MSLEIPSTSSSILSTSPSSNSLASSSLSSASTKLLRLAKKASKFIAKPVRRRIIGKSWSPAENLDKFEQINAKVIRIMSKEEQLFQQYDVLIPKALYNAVREHFADHPDTFHYIPAENFYGVRFGQGMGAVELLVPLFEELPLAFRMFPFDKMIENYQGQFNLTYIIHLAAICSFSRHLRWRQAFSFGQMLQVFGSTLELALIENRCTKYLRLTRIKVKDIPEFAEEILNQFYFHSGGKI